MSDRLPFKINDYILERLIGKGSYGKVYLAQHANHFGLFAIKMVKRKLMEKNNNVFKMFKDEVNITSTIDHPNIIHLYQAFMNEEYYYLVYDYCEQGNFLKIEP